MSLWVICGIIAISKSIIILPYIRGSLWAICGISMISTSVRVLPEEWEISDYNKSIHTYHPGKQSPKDSWDDKIDPEHYLNNICQYISKLKQWITTISQEKVNEHTFPKSKNLIQDVPRKIHITGMTS